MIQIDIDMPKTCDDCPFHIYHSGKKYVCVATPLFYPMNLANYKDGRKDFCPLKEVSQEPILDKINELIEPLRHSSCEMTNIEWQILQVVDKYKAESEDKESAHEEDN